MIREGRVAGFEEKRPRAGPGWINGGVYVMSRQSLEPFRRGTAFSLEKEIFPQLGAGASPPMRAMPGSRTSAPWPPSKRFANG